jgi:hypothetical protein
VSHSASTDSHGYPHGQTATTWTTEGESPHGQRRSYPVTRLASRPLRCLLARRYPHGHGHECKRYHPYARRPNQLRPPRGGELRGFPEISLPCTRAPHDTGFRNPAPGPANLTHHLVPMSLRTWRHTTALSCNRFHRRFIPPPRSGPLPHSGQFAPTAPSMASTPVAPAHFVDILASKSLFRVKCEYESPAPSLSCDGNQDGSEPGHARRQQRHHHRGPAAHANTPTRTP